MAYPEVIIPPSVRPESPSEPQLIDDETTLFQPRFGRGTTQRQLWADPLWGWRLRYRGLASADRALIRQAILEARGKAVNIRVTPGLPLRGSFPATELLTNNDFSNGTTGWTVDDGTGAVSDRVFRATHSGAKTIGYLEVQQSVTLTQYVPYVARAFYSYGSDWPTSGSSVGQFINSVSNYVGGARGLNTLAAVNTSSGSQAIYPLVALDNNGAVAGQYIDLPFASLSRCILVDNGPNALTYSDQFDNAAWVKSGILSTTANSVAQTDPWGTNTAEKLVENTSTGGHYTVQSGPSVSATADYCGVVFARQDNLDRDIQVIVGTTGTGHYGYCTFDLGAGTVGTHGNAGSATNERSFIKSLGNFWYACFVVVRLPTAAVRADLQIMMISGGTDSYTGTTGTLMLVRGGVAQSSVPFNPALTTSALTTGTAQTGGTLNVKGLPVSTSGLLLAGDFVEINGELKQVTASLDSDAAGLGVLKFRPGLWVSPADNDPIIVNNPMGRFRLASDPRITENFGLYTDVELDLIEAGP